MQNGFVQASTGECAPLGDACIACWARDELLNETMFRNLAHARVVIAAWAADDNTERPRSALDDQTPADEARALTTAIARLGAREMKAPRDARLLNLRQLA